ncbi:MAG: DUF6502 family protein [Steroidobacteraceae bacterium]
MLPSKLALHQSCLRLLRPLARIMLRHGMSTYDFSRIANIAFVHAARDILREQGKPLSFSRVSTITGLHRHVVSDIVNSEAPGGPDPAAEKDYRRNRLARVLAGWFESPEYTDSEGRPQVLSVEGPAPSFESLVRSFSGDIYPKIILEELTQVGAVRILKDGSLRAVTRRYTLGGADPAALEHLGAAAYDVLSTLEHNLAARPEGRLYDDGVVALDLDRAAMPLFRRLMRERGAAFLEDIEGWIREHENPDAPQTVRAGVMVQMFVDNRPEADDNPPGPRQA